MAFATIGQALTGLITRGAYDSNQARESLASNAGPTARAKLRAAENDPAAGNSTTRSATVGTGSNSPRPTDENTFWKGYTKDNASIDWSKYRDNS